MMSRPSLFESPGSWDVIYAVPAAVLLYFVASRPRAGVGLLLGLPLVVALGEASYAFYLIHEPLGEALGASVDVNAGTPARRRAVRLPDRAAGAARVGDPRRGRAAEPAGDPARAVASALRAARARRPRFGAGDTSCDWSSDTGTRPEAADRPGAERTTDACLDRCRQGSPAKPNGARRLSHFCDRSLTRRTAPARSSGRAPRPSRAACRRACARPTARRRSPADRAVFVPSTTGPIANWAPPLPGCRSGPW